MNEEMVVEVEKVLPDMQNTADVRGVDIDQVGVCDLLYPMDVLDRETDRQRVVATISMSVTLPHHFKGTHMSRFLEVLNEYAGQVMSMQVMPRILGMLLERLDAAAAQIRIEFPYFVLRRAPVSGMVAPMDYRCGFVGQSQVGGMDQFQMLVEVPVSTLCPCSKEISDYGAHNQRGVVRLKVTPRRAKGEWAWIWFEELIDLCERAGSAPVRSLLKRVDERHVTMQAYDNPVFVEDVVRNVSIVLARDPRVAEFAVRAINHESIHNHSAFARVQRVLV